MLMLPWGSKALPEGHNARHGAVQARISSYSMTSVATCCLPCHLQEQSRPQAPGRLFKLEVAWVPPTSQLFLSLIIPSPIQSHTNISASLNTLLEHLKQYTRQSTILPTAEKQSSTSAT